MNWSVFPALRLSIAFFIGVVVGNVVDIAPYFAFAMLLFGLLTLFFVDRRNGLRGITTRSMSAFLLLVALLIGMTRVQLQKPNYDRLHYSQQITDTTDIAIVKVLEDIKYKTSIKTTVSVLSINGKIGRGKLLIYFPKGDTLSHIKPGDLLAIKSTISPTRANTNPASFDYKSYLKNRGINHQAYLRAGTYYKVKDGRLPWLFQVTYDLRERALKILESRLRTKDQLATASAMILGYRDHISQELYTAYATTGSVHVLAVSGLHVGIICWIFVILFKQIKSERPRVKVFKMTILLIVVWFYAILTGAAPAVIRAAVMFSIMIVGKYWFDNQNIYNSLAISAVVLLMYDPYLLFQASFQFSYLALLGILYFHKLLYPLFETKYSILDKIWNLAVVAIAAQTLVFPVTVYYFHKFPMYFILSGIVSVSIAFFILINGLLVLSLSWVPVLGDVLSWSLRSILDVFIGIIYVIRDWPMSNISGLWLSPMTTVLIYIGLAIIMALVRWSKNIKLWYALSFIGLFLMIQNVRFNIRTSEQSAIVVYDTGRESLVDLIDGKMCKTIRSEGLTPTKETFASDNYRIGKNIHTTTGLYPNHLRNGLLQYRDQIIYIPSMATDLSLVPTKADIMIVNNQLDDEAARFTTMESIRKIVIDKSIDWHKRRAWERFADARNIELHDVRAAGAFVLE